MVGKWQVMIGSTLEIREALAGEVDRDSSVAAGGRTQSCQLDGFADCIDD